MNQIEAEYLAEMDKYGNTTGEIVKREVAHEKGVLHLSIHVWCIDPQDFIEEKSEDIFIHIAVRAKNKSDTGKPYLQRTVGGHLKILSEWDKKMVDENNKKALSLKTLIEEVKEELGISLLKETEDERIFEEITLGESFILDNGKKINLLYENIEYGGTREKNENGKTRIIRNNEIIDIYSFEHIGEIKWFDKTEIEGIQRIPSKILMEMIENNFEIFGEDNEAQWKNSTKYKVMKMTLEKIQKIYNLN